MSTHLKVRPKYQYLVTVTRMLTAADDRREGSQSTSSSPTSPAPQYCQPRDNTVSYSYKLYAEDPLYKWDASSVSQGSRLCLIMSLLFYSWLTSQAKTRMSLWSRCTIATGMSTEPLTCCWRVAQTLWVLALCEGLVLSGPGSGEIRATLG